MSGGEREWVGGLGGDVIGPRLVVHVSTGLWRRSRGVRRQTVGARCAAYIPPFSRPFYLLPLSARAIHRAWGEVQFEFRRTMV